MYTCIVHGHIYVQAFALLAKPPDQGYLTFSFFLALVQPLFLSAELNGANINLEMALDFQLALFQLSE